MGARRKDGKEARKKDEKGVTGRGERGGSVFVGWEGVAEEG